MKNIFDLLKEYKWVIFWTVVIFTITGLFEYFTGRSPLGPDGKFGLWEASVWSSENSQRVADAYTFSHIIHGMLFFGLLHLVARKVPMKYKLVMALGLEAGWEILENSPLIINRYREVTIAQGYVGDSILNSLSDVVFAGIGFSIARFSKFWATIFLIILMEIGCLFWVRDNLTLNIVMLAYPSKTIQQWQSVGH